MKQALKDMLYSTGYDLSRRSIQRALETDISEMLRQKHKGQTYHVATIMHKLRDEVIAWLNENELDQNTFRNEEVTLIVFQILMDSGTTIKIKG
jgi:hypothetical protein